MNKLLKGVIYGSIAAASYGTNPLFAIPLFRHGIGVNSVLFYRYFIAVIVYFIIAKYIKKKSLKLHKNEVLPLIVMGLLFSFSSVTLFESFRYIDAGIACTILFIYPVIVAVIMSIFFKEKITKSAICSIILTSIGIVLLYNGNLKGNLNIHGLIAVFISALVYALYIVGVKTNKTISHINRVKFNFYVMLFGLSVYIVNLRMCTELQLPEKPILWVLLFGLAIFPTIISIETITIAIKLTGPTLTAILGALEPLTAIVIGVTLFNEELTLRITAGIIMILSGVYTIVVSRQKQNINLQ